MQSSIQLRSKVPVVCQRREAGLKCTDLRSYNIAEDDGNSDNDADDDHHELSDVDNVDDDHNLQG